MLLSTEGWRRYHELVCSPGLPWDCEKKCVLWQRFDWQRRQSEGKGYATYMDIERKG